MAKNIIHSLCASAFVPLIAKKFCCLRVSSTLRICVHCRTPFYITPPFLVKPTLMQPHAWARWYRPSSYRYWLCRVPVNALLSHYDPRKIFDLFMVTWRVSLTRILRRSQSALSYTGDWDVFFPLLSVYASCSFSIRYNILYLYKLSLTAMHESSLLSD